jgi:hypothetical protein
MTTIRTTSTTQNARSKGRLACEDLPADRLTEVANQIGLARSLTSLVESFMMNSAFDRVSPHCRLRIETTIYGIHSIHHQSKPGLVASQIVPKEFILQIQPKSRPAATKHLTHC